ncbi:MAG: hypothetical protein LBL01_01840, partial [Bifidobacteriaceae bacterium]|nr:hypothetical protein [Bifidobacteriaceae bacterium]
QVAAIVAVLAVTQFVEPILRALPMLTGWDWRWTEFLPGAAGDTIQGASFYTAMMGEAGPSAALPWGWAALVLAGWAALFAGVAYPASWRRDIS